MNPPAEPRPAPEPRPPAARLATDGPLAIRDAPFEIGQLDLSAWLPSSPLQSTQSTQSAQSTQSTASAPGAGAAPSPVDALASLAVEAWRVKGRLAKLSGAVPAKELRPLEAAVAKMEESLAGAGVSVDDPVGRPFHEGDPFEVLLFEPSPALARPTVVQTVKPAVLLAGKLVRRAEVVVGTPGEAAAGKEGPA